MSSVMSNYLGNWVLRTKLTLGVCWLALHNGDPTPVGDLGTELAGGDYIRQRIHFGVASSRAVANTDSGAFPPLAADEVTYLGLWDDQIAGNFLMPIRLITPIPVGASSLFLWGPGDIAFQF